MDYIIGVDCGGTSTEAEAYSLNGDLLEKTNAGFGNLLIDESIALKNIQSSINLLMETLSNSNCISIIIGVAGVDSGGFKEKIENVFSDYTCPVTIINDGKLAYFSLLQGRDGIAITAGTGSVILGNFFGKWYRVGGWGHLLGDEGSAYYIAKEAIQVSLHEYDTGQSVSNFTKEIFSFFNVCDIFQLTRKIYNSSKDEIANLTRFISEKIPDCEPTEKILMKAGFSLGKQVTYLINQLPKSQDNYLIGLTGSVLQNNLVVRDHLSKYLQQQDYQFSLLEKKESSSKGAYYLFKRNEEKK